MKRRERRGNYEKKNRFKAKRIKEKRLKQSVTCHLGWFVGYLWVPWGMTWLAW